MLTYPIKFRGGFYYEIKKIIIINISRANKFSFISRMFYSKWRR